MHTYAASFIHTQVEIDRRDFARKLVQILKFDSGFRRLGEGKIRVRLEKPEHIAPLCKIKVSGLAPRGIVVINQQLLETIFVDEWKLTGVEEISVTQRDENVGFVLFETPQLARKALKHNGKYLLRLKVMKPRRIPKQNVRRKDGQRMGGVVDTWGRGFGLITPDDGGEDVFIHNSNIVDGRDLLEDSRVEFTLAPNPDPKPTRFNSDVWRAQELTGGVSQGCLYAWAREDDASVKCGVDFGGVGGGG